MKIGAVFPQTEFPPDPAAVRDYAQAVEAMGFSHVLAYDHVLGANPDRPGGWQGAYTFRDPFLEPLVLFSYLAAFTRELEFTTGIIILPQRQTALFARQAATLDVLAGGRTRLGIGLGWNRVEYTALNEDFSTRGRRIEEQVEVLRKLWTQPLVQFEGRWHHIPDAGLNPLPVQRPIPLWMGGQAEPVLRRTARLGDGWMPNYRNPADARPAAEMLKELLRQEGRDPETFGIEARMAYGSGDPTELHPVFAAWKDLGATHITVNTMKQGFAKPEQHLEALRRFIEAAQDW